MVNPTKKCFILYKLSNVIWLTFIQSIPINSKKENQWKLKPWVKRLIIEILRKDDVQSEKEIIAPQ